MSVGKVVGEFRHLSILEALYGRRGGHRQGPGRRSVVTLHLRLAKGSRYSPADVRRLGGERGVGRPPHVILERREVS